jgi:hypothetical protein
VLKYRFFDSWQNQKAKKTQTGRLFVQQNVENKEGVHEIIFNVAKIHKKSNSTCFFPKKTQHTSKK